jgi:DNA-directed RNA polymerase specialized sigma24 family protein
MIRETKYDELEKQYTRLIGKFAQWPVHGLAPEDIAQELRLVLLKAGKRYDPDRGCGFMHYLYRAFSNRMGQLAAMSRKKKRVPPESLVQLEDAADPFGHELGYERVELETGLSPVCLKLVKAVLDDDMTSRDVLLHGRLSPDEFTTAKQELREHLRRV